MAHFSASDINEAKRRVQEMQERAKSYSEQSVQNDNPQNEAKKEHKNEKKSADSSVFSMFDILGDLTSSDDSSKGIILALILILAREKADNMLILALLYILL